MLSGAVVDTAYFNGKFPDICSIQAADMSNFGAGAVTTASMFWPERTVQQKLQADHVHALSAHIQVIRPVAHVWLNIFPDGGVSRLNMTGRFA